MSSLGTTLHHRTCRIHSRCGHNTSAARCQQAAASLHALTRITRLRGCDHRAPERTESNLTRCWRHRRGPTGSVARTWCPNTEPWEGGIMTRVAVIGAGPMGLATAYHLLRAGHTVDVFEADERPGGMAAHFDLDGLDIERFYHFICKADRTTFALLAELGIADKLRWRPTSMGLFCAGELYPWGNPLELLRFPHLDIVSKIRYGLHMFLLTRRTGWAGLDGLHADDWLRARQGERTWQLVWKKLFTLKFFEFSHDISAAWIWARVKRLGTSRRSLMQEELGYLEGGSRTLIDTLVARIETLGGR